MTAIQDDMSNAMPPSVMLDGDYALFRPDGVKTLEGVATEIDRSVIWCRDSGTAGCSRICGS